MIYLSAVIMQMRILQLARETYVLTYSFRAAGRVLMEGVLQNFVLRDSRQRCVVDKIHKCWLA